ncbi:MAG: sigma-54-dependent Fis family transcriptional regulator [Bacteroidetes bacterium]|nr:sigma-54-dependent Fis family transcriptional regulator [Bacteroidota bacterium]
MKTILIIDDDIQICTLLSNFLNKSGYETSYATTANKGLNYLKENKAQLVISDYRLPDINGAELLIKIKNQYEEIPVLIISGYSDVKVAVEVMKNGAFDFISKPFAPHDILPLIELAINGETAQQEISTVALPVKTELPDLLIEKNKLSEKLFDQIKLVAPTNYSVIIYGESGTGKESVAYNIHKESKRKNGPFIAVDCGALTKELAGSELFGHEKGSFTGAIQKKIGQFELANGGTLFLDEIGNLPYDTQVSLLRVIQERKIRMVGSEKETDIDVRIIVASNEKLSEITATGKFREDLYHRFNEFTIELLPLRKQGEEIMAFARLFLEQANKELSKNVAFSPEIENIFLDYDWPGNLREMKNVLKRCVLLAETFIIPELLPQDLLKQVNHSGIEIKRIKDKLPQDLNMKETALQAEYLQIIYVLQQVNFNKSKAARILKIDRKTLYNKIEAYDLLMLA